MRAPDPHRSSLACVLSELVAAASEMSAAARLQGDWLNALPAAMGRLSLELGGVRPVLAPARPAPLRPIDPAGPGIMAP